ncbi:MAG: hypothetical protein GXP49_00075 [Deltaproteobacteria bacterium]|nr:hypothetical protein [Deltaproteobacteria bacterium]
MRKTFVLSLAVVSGLLLGGCGLMGMPAFYSDIMGNQYYQSGQTTDPGGKVVTGQACWHSYVGVYAAGDASVAQALADAGVDNTKNLKNIVVDHKIFAIGPFYMEYCTIVTATVYGSGGGGMAQPAPATEQPASTNTGENQGESNF